MIRYAAVRLLDLLDDRVLGHRWDGLCYWTGLHPWWRARCESGGHALEALPPRGRLYCRGCGWSQDAIESGDFT